MTIQGPSVVFSENDKRLMQLLAQLLADCETPASTNAPRGTSPLSDAEALELAKRVESALESQEFWQASRLIETISGGDREAAREVYLSGRARHGFSRIMSSSHYNSFLARLGFEASVHRPFAYEMEYEHFVRMEAKLFGRLGVNPDVVKLLERFLWSRAGAVDLARKGKNRIEDGLIIKALKSIRPERDAGGHVVGGVWTANRIAGALTLFANMTVMFTTRDWSVTGTMSTMAGSIGLLAKG